MLKTLFYRELVFMIIPSYVSHSIYFSQVPHFEDLFSIFPIIAIKKIETSGIYINYALFFTIDKKFCSVLFCVQSSFTIF